MKRLRPFFNYFGSKYRIAPKYPKPKYDTIVEPFAGAASYSCLHYDKNVILMERDPRVVEIWRYLINASPEKILALPDVEPDTPIFDLDVPKGAKYLISRWCWISGSGFCRKPSPSSVRYRDSGSARIWIRQVRERLAEQVQYIRHWYVLGACDSLFVQGGEPATWFVDPPYQRLGREYKYKLQASDYAVLADWCKSRKGQVIVCESEGADWLPFEKLCQNHGNRSTKSHEMMWVKG